MTFPLDKAPSSSASAAGSGKQAACNTQRQQHRKLGTIFGHDVQPVSMDFAESVAVPDHRLAVPMIMSMAMRVIVGSMVVTMLPRVSIRRPTCSVARLAGFAHSERHKIALRPQHP